MVCVSNPPLSNPGLSLSHPPGTLPCLGCNNGPLWPFGVVVWQQNLSTLPIYPSGVLKFCFLEKPQRSNPQSGDRMIAGQRGGGGCQCQRSGNSTRQMKPKDHHSQPPTPGRPVGQGGEDEASGAGTTKGGGERQPVCRPSEGDRLGAGGCVPAARKGRIIVQ